ncbi:MAG: hypothetical protein E7164_00225 [Firmicutes bacterium]|nr:hypothetical protein [Bacillota bacterium]
MTELEKIIIMLQKDMVEPKPWGWFHFLWIFFVIITVYYLYKIKNRHNEKQLKYILGIYGIGALVLEILKQIIWSFEFDGATLSKVWDYQWYAFPFQLCSTPIYVSILALFLKKGRLRDSLLSYMAFITILGSIMTVIIPDSCFVEDILVNIHTMYLHCGSLVVSLYLVISKEIKVEKQYLLKGYITFLGFVYVAELLNIIMYKSRIIGDETFNMFYISPYFNSELPVFSTLQSNLPYLLYIITYLLAIGLGGIIVYYIFYLFKKRQKF